MIKKHFETIKGQSVFIDVPNEAPCRHDEVEFLNAESLGCPPIWVCSKCGKEFNENEFLKLQQSNLN
ncbi:MULTISPECIES: hypothetical protein [unclassified Acinetobacter]|uniref:hypothetical protein n=1 Tax=unclassified Acinetobacter TaxID=196816 RepID=UPI00124EFA08|nr:MULTISPECIES: hypothetical protein [unclassified Acinetobacter]